MRLNFFLSHIYVLPDSEVVKREWFYVYEYLLSFTGVVWIWILAHVSFTPEMEPWPIMAWGLMLSAIAGWIKTVQSRDFTEKDIIFLHPSSMFTFWKHL